MKDSKNTRFRRYLQHIKDVLTFVKLLELFFKIYGHRYIIIKVFWIVVSLSSIKSEAKYTLKPSAMQEQPILSAEVSLEVSVWDDDYGISASEKYHTKTSN